MMRGTVRFLPAVLMGLGALLLLGVNRQKVMPLAEPLSTLPMEILGLAGRDHPIPADEQQVAGMTNYVLRDFLNPVDSTFAFSVYVGYYDRQTQGKTIHSPKNCLPGAGWEPTAVSDQEIVVGGQRVVVRRYLLAKDQTRAMVYYWYEGRGRVSSNEYRVKWELLRDAALTGRSEEALVRIVLPLTRGEAFADSTAQNVARSIIPAIERALPAYPSRSLQLVASR
jgi:EpsI family protein